MRARERVCVSNIDEPMNARNTETDRERVRER